MEPRTTTTEPSLSAVPRRRSRVTPQAGEPIAPWLAGAFVLAVVNLVIVVRAHQALMVEQSMLLIGLCGTLAAGGLVSSRANRAHEASLREDRARPAADELAGHSSEAGSASYVQGMERWTAAVLELLEHAMSVTDPGTPAHEELAAAAAETRDLHDLLDVGSADPLTINDQAKLHALGSLWETSQLRLEQLAVEVDAPWHRRWQARYVVERRLRYGHDLPRPLVLPYRA